MRNLFEHYMEAADGDISDELSKRYEKLKALLEKTEKDMNVVYTMVDSMKEDENSAFRAVYEDFNAALVEFQDMMMFVKGAVG